MDPKRDKRKIDEIVREPLTHARLFLNGKLRAAAQAENPDPFTLQDLQDFALKMPDAAPDYRSEVLNVMEAVQTGRAPQAPRFDTPSMQLLWGAALSYLTLNPDAMNLWTAADGKPAPSDPPPLAATPLWKQVTDTRAATEELLSHAWHVREALRDKGTKYNWGAPGTGFAFDRKQNRIDIDFMQSLIVGFEHARADVYREVGHALLSVTYPRRMRELYREMAPLMKRSQAAQDKRGPQLKPEEYKQLRLLSAEWQLRHMLFTAAEENVANRFVANMGQQMLQDFGVSLNNTAVTHRGVGLTRPPQGEGVSDDLRRYVNLCNAVQLGFFANNNLFDGSDRGWRKVGVDPGLIRRTSTLAARPEGAKDDGDGVAHPDFLHLRELCGGPQGLENLQPRQKERLYGWRNMAGHIARADQSRKAVIEEIWDQYAENLIQNILRQVNDDVDQQMKQKQQDKQDNPDQDDQDGQEQDDQGQPQKGKKSGKGKKQHGRPQGDMDDTDDAGDSDDAEADDADDADAGKKDAGKQKDKNKEKGKSRDKGKDKDKGEKDGQEQDAGEDGQQGQDGGKDSKQAGKAEGDLGADEDETVPVEGVGDMPAPDKGLENPGDELAPDGAESDAGGDNGGDGADADDDDGRTLEDLEKDLSDKDAQEDGQESQDGDGQDADGEGQDGAKKGSKGRKDKPSHQAGTGKGKSLGDLAKQDWTDYQARVAELAGPIAVTRKLFRKVQERQMQRKRSVSPSLTILPENGEVKDRFNVEAHRNLTIKKAAGNVEEGDLKRFHNDNVNMVPAEIDVVIMIDGSGSMGSGSPSPLDSALQAAAIIYEAASGKDMHMNVYVGMWGNDEAPILIRPGDDRVTIGRTMQAARRGLHSGTDLAPAVARVADTIGNARGKSGVLSGFTHVLVISDGDINDPGNARKNIDAMFAHSDRVTFDVAIVESSYGGATMRKMAADVRGNKPWQGVGITTGKDPDRIPLAIVGLLLDKINKCGSFVAVPNSQKRRAMKKARNKMDPKR